LETTRPTSETTGIALPADDAVRPDVPVQWWYWTGHLEARDGRRFGFEECFFAIDSVDDFFGSVLADEFLKQSLTRDVAGFQVAHCALTDVANQMFHSRVDYILGMPRPRDNGFDLRTQFPVADKVTASGGDGADRLHGDVGGCVFDLVLTNHPDHPPVLHYGGLRHDFAFGGFVYYYSRPHMTATGTLRIGDEILDVSGVAWFDREFGVLGALAKQSWQWFAVELVDGRQIMVADIAGYPGEGFCTVINGGEHQVLRGADAYRLDVLDHWQSPHTGIVYPSKWRLTCAGEQFVVTPLVADQELQHPWQSPKYWEGTASVSGGDGQTVGQAYVELAGYKAQG
jgi:predicted secreted hydrolase